MSQNLEFLNQARKMLTDDYYNRHTAEYNQWLLNHKNSWAQPHMVVPFPPFIVSAALAPFKSSITSPSEEQIVAKALELYAQSNPVVAPVATAVTKSVTEVAVEPVTEVAVEPVAEEVVEPVAEEVVAEEVVAEEVVEPVAEEVVEPVAEEVVEPIAVYSTTTDNLYSSEIHKIYQDAIISVTVDSQFINRIEEENKIEETSPTFKTIEKDLSVVPQPIEELAKVKSSSGILPSVLQRLQDMTSKWSHDN